MADSLLGRRRPLHCMSDSAGVHANEHDFLRSAKTTWFNLTGKDMTLFVSSFFLAIAFCAPPGVVTAETVRRGAARGFFPALFVQLGSLVGDTTWAILALTGLAFIVHNQAAKF